METLLADLRQSLRALRSNPGFTLVALAALTVGIGATTGIFSVVNRVLLQALPYQDSERLVQLGPKSPAVSRLWPRRATQSSCPSLRSLFPR